MTDPNRRELLKAAGLGGVAAGASLPASAAVRGSDSRSPAAGAKSDRTGVGIEGQRRADRGDGTFLNPVIAGDHPDPTVLKDGDDYWMTYSSFDYYPGVVIWHSRDLVNWSPVGPALKTWIGSVFAVDIAKHAGRYFIYIPTLRPQYGLDGAVTGADVKIHVVHAESMRGPWSEPIDMGISGHIDPGHIVGEDGKRYLFMNKGARVRITDDGLHADGAVETVYDGWRYPKDWVVETYALEGPKLLRRNSWFYMISAVGGTAGPPTSHLVIVARSRSINGPWENCPFNPIVRTADAAARWWSRGHATAVEGPGGDWWMVYHGYENGFRTLGRQMLLDPIEWTADGWIRPKGGDLSRPLLKPHGAAAGPSGLAQSTDFAIDSMGTRLCTYTLGAQADGRFAFGPDGLSMRAIGKGPGESSPLSLNVGDHRYEVVVEVTPEAGAQGGLLLFYNPTLFVGFGIDGDQIRTHRNGREETLYRIPRPAGQSLWLRIVNDAHVVTMSYSIDRANWIQTLIRMEVSGYHQNVGGGFLSLRPALFASGGAGSVRFRHLAYRAGMSF